jgi:hypothetical protein
MSLGRKCCRVLLFVLVATACMAQRDDSHLTQDPAERLYTESPFAHGYIHGYQMGFHCGDLDLQMSHEPQVLKNEKHFKDGIHHFRHIYGDKSSFVQGYEAGFRMGYADGYEGTEFRAIQNLRELSKDLPDVDQNASPILDTALMRGYVDGRKNGLGDGRANADYRPDGSDCELALRFKEAPTTFYCSAYSLGYRFGYSDGFHNQRPEQSPQLARSE